MIMEEELKVKLNAVLISGVGIKDGAKDSIVFRTGLNNEDKVTEIAETIAENFVELKVVPNKRLAYTLITTLTLTLENFVEVYDRGRPYLNLQNDLYIELFNNFVIQTIIENESLYEFKKVFEHITPNTAVRIFDQTLLSFS